MKNERKVGLDYSGMNPKIARRPQQNGGEQQGEAKTAFSLTITINSSSFIFAPSALSILTMLSALTLALSLASASFVAAQSNSSDGALQIEAIEAHFTNAGLVPSLLATFDPSSILNLTYDSVGAISPGQLLSKDRAYYPDHCGMFTDMHV